MVKISNIEMKDMIISAICFPEGKENNSFKILVNADTAEIVENSSGKDSIYASMSAVKLSKLKDNLPNETIVMWC